MMESRRVLIAGGTLMIRVSAYPWLLGDHDRAFGTGRRYSAKEVCLALHDAGMKIERITHANLLMLLPAIILRLAVMAKITSVEAGFSPARAFRATLIAALQTEAKILRSLRLPAGLSLYAIAQKKAA
jgi:hypothetical protein